jgi:putative membrane protein
MKQTFASTALAAALVAGLSAWAAGTGTLENSDVKFIQKAAAGGMGEVELGKLAQQKAVREETKQFATRMVEDHTKANDDLARMAGANGVNLAQAMDEGTRKEMDRLQKLQGMDFDRAYMKHMVKDHKKDLKEFRHEAKANRDSDAKAFAQRTLPTLEEHLAMAQKTYDIAEASKHEGNRVVGSTH